MRKWEGSLEYKKIWNRCEELGLLFEKTNFTCYVEYCFEFEITNGNKRFCFSFIGADNSIVSDPELEWLLNLDNIEYFSFEEHIIDGYYTDGTIKWKRLDLIAFKQPDFSLN